MKRNISVILAVVLACLTLLGCGGKQTVSKYHIEYLNKEKTGMPKIRDLNKEYVLDWTYFSEYAGHMHNVPQNVRIINYPFYAHYQKELYLLGTLFVLTFILISIILLRMHRRSLIEHKIFKCWKRFKSD